MYSPALAVAGPDLSTARSALRLTVVLTESESFALFGSVGDWLPTEAVLLRVPAAALGLIWARIRTVLVAPLLSAPTAWGPLERVSVSAAEVPSEGPLLVTSIR